MRSALAAIEQIKLSLRLEFDQALRDVQGGRGSTPWWESARRRKKERQRTDGATVPGVQADQSCGAANTLGATSDDSRRVTQITAICLPFDRSALQVAIFRRTRAER